MISSRLNSKLKEEEDSKGGQSRLVFSGDAEVHGSPKQD